MWCSTHLRPIPLVLSLFLVVWAVPGVAAQDVVEISRLQNPISLDGMPDDPAWQAIAPLPTEMLAPTFQGEKTERTDIRVAYDDDHLYVACQCYTEDTDDVTVNSYERNVMNRGSDFCFVILDTFNDNENALGFGTTPLGTRTDFQVFDDAEGEEPINLNWDTFWSVATQQNEAGWFAEMRIPFSSLGFQEEDGRADMGLITLRYIASKNEWHIFPAIPPDWGFWSFVKPSQSQPVRFDGIYSRNPLRITPYALGGLGQNHHLNDSGSAYERIRDATYDLGLDARYRLTNNLTLDATINTDFAQVEADDEEVNLTRFSLFFPEKRRFFQERSSIFDFRFGAFDRLFYSRRIGLHEGQTLPILGGLRLVGRVGGWDVGALNMQTGRADEARFEGPAPPSENLGVLRMRRRVLNPYSYLGGMLTSRLDTEGGYNVAGGVDGIFRLFGQDYLTFAWAQTADEAHATHPVDAARLRLQWQRRTHEGLGYDLKVQRSGQEYRPSLGFQLREDFNQWGTEVSYGWSPGAASPLRMHRIALGNDVFLRNADGSVETVELESVWEGELKTGAEFASELRMIHEDLRQPFMLSDEVGVPEGRYTFAALGARYQTPGARTVRGYVTGEAGTFYDGYRFLLEGGPRWVVAPHFELWTTYEYNRARFPDRDDRFVAHVGRIRMRVSLNTAFSAFAFVQYNSTADAVRINTRFRYNPREGNDLYLVFNEVLNTNRNAFDPVPPLTAHRTLMIKYTYTFTL